MLLEENQPLAPFTTFGIGGPARWFVAAQSEDDIVEACAWSRDRGIPLFVLGGGSNLLVSDAGFPGLDGEDAKATEFNTVAPAQGLLHSFEDGVHGGLCLRPWKAGAFNYPLN